MEKNRVAGDKIKSEWSELIEKKFFCHHHELLKKFFFFFPSQSIMKMILARLSQFHFSNLRIPGISGYNLFGC